MLSDSLQDDTGHVSVNSSGESYSDSNSNSTGNAEKNVSFGFKVKNPESLSEEAREFPVVPGDMDIFSLTSSDTDHGMLSAEFRTPGGCLHEDCFSWCHESRADKDVFVILASDEGEDSEDNNAGQIHRSWIVGKTNDVISQTAVMELDTKNTSCSLNEKVAEDIETLRIKSFNKRNVPCLADTMLVQAANNDGHICSILKVATEEDQEPSGKADTVVTTGLEDISSKQTESAVENKDFQNRKEGSDEDVSLSSETQAWLDQNNFETDICCDQASSNQHDEYPHTGYYESQDITLPENLHVSKRRIVKCGLMEASNSAVSKSGASEGASAKSDNLHQISEGGDVIMDDDSDSATVSREYFVRTDGMEDMLVQTDPADLELSWMFEPILNDVSDRSAENTGMFRTGVSNDDVSTVAPPTAAPPTASSNLSLRSKKRKKHKAKLDKYLSKYTPSQENRSRKYATSFKELLPEPQDDFHPDFTCPVCLDLYHRPQIVSPCQHMFCEPCLRKLPSSAMADNAVCPLCRCDIHSCSLDVDLHLQLSSYYSHLYNKRARQEKKLKTNQNPLPRLYTAPLSQQLIRQIFRNSQSQRRNQTNSCFIILGVCMSAVLSVLYVWLNIPIEISTGPLRNAAISNIWIQAICLFAVLAWMFVRLLQTFADGTQR